MIMAMPKAEPETTGQGRYIGVGVVPDGKQGIDGLHCCMGEKEFVIETLREADDIEVGAIFSSKAKFDANIYDWLMEVGSFHAEAEELIKILNADLEAFRLEDEAKGKCDDPTA